MEAAKFSPPDDFVRRKPLVHEKGIRRIDSRRINRHGATTLSDAD